MGVKFFGTFLIESLEVDPPALREALDLMESENLTLGELAVEAGFASGADCRRVNGEQRRLDRPFGELAVEMGVLNSIELEELLQRQIESRINVGDALVRLGKLSRDRLSILEDQFKRDQGDVDYSEVQLPEPIEGNRLARVLVDMVPRYAMRVARLDARTESGVEVGRMDSDMNVVASLVMVGNPGIEMHLMSELSFARKISSGISSLPESILTAELCLDGLGEFLNVVAGNAMSSLEAEGVEFRLEAPCYGQFPEAGWSFSIASDWGKATMVLNEL